MPHHTIDFVSTAAPLLKVNRPVSWKAAFGDRIARDYAAAPITDLEWIAAEMQSQFK
jgi:hypothetical protein